MEKVVHWPRPTTKFPPTQSLQAIPYSMESLIYLNLKEYEEENE
jgi:hypothetical protein